jgi:8-oxo-dGTP pyrophosphatase MutT (NUDIX family)
LNSANEGPLYRPSARIVLLDPADRILLIHVVAGDTDDGSFWITPGGGLEGGESFEQAALRELWEETGLDGLPLGPCVWVRRHVWRWGSKSIDSDERFYLVRTDRTEVRLMVPDEIEAGNFEGFRWWTLQELETSSEIFAPRRMATLVALLLAGEVPPQPLSVGR